MSELIIETHLVDINIDDCVDFSGCLEISFGYELGYIEKQHAIDIIKHLSKVFDINLKNID